MKAMCFSWRCQYRCTENGLLSLISFLHKLIPEPWARHSLTISLLFHSASEKLISFSPQNECISQNFSIHLSLLLGNENLEQDIGKCSLLYHRNPIGPYRTITWGTNNTNTSQFYLKQAVKQMANEERYAWYWRKPIL